MKAVTYTQYGPPEVLRVTQVDKPKPGTGEVLIQVHAATSNRTDTGFRSAKYFITRLFSGLTKPKRPISGSEFAGVVVELGHGVTTLKPGDRVFGFDDIRGGAYAEFMTRAADGPIAIIPQGFSYQDIAAAGEGATYALNVINAVPITKGQKVLVYGATGAIGSAAVQLLKHRRAEVTAVCGTAHVDLVKSLGADQVISYQTQDFTAIGDKFDLVFDAVGKSSYGACKKLFNSNGKYYSSELGPGGQNPFLALFFAITGSRKVLFPIPKINQQVIQHIAHLIETGAFKPLVDRTYPLDDIVEATRYVETGQKIGNVVIKVP